MTARFFADTNIAVYTLGATDLKGPQALAIMRQRPVISTQVVNEFLSVMLGKRKFERAQAYRLARILMRRCDVVAVTPEITDLSMTIGERYQLSHWDSLIVAAALTSGCDTLYSEDMQDGQVFEGRLTVRNPFTG
ncbi:MAG: PIN domain-containing protein [Sulfurisoma sp.]|nr:PIN domain-containing protein [Sulfurisoma sp.]